MLSGFPLACCLSAYMLPFRQHAAFFMQPLQLYMYLVSYSKNTFSVFTCSRNQENNLEEVGEKLNDKVRFGMGDGTS